MDIMIDLETMGTRPGCAVLSIGAVMFDRATGETFGEFYRVIDLKSCIDLGMTIDAGTVEWWMNQSEQARAAAFPMDEFAKETATRAADQFVEWFAQAGGAACPVWCHGLTFDLPILEEFLRLCGWPNTPWAFWQARDTRTVYDIVGFDPKALPREGTYHNALDDARHQAKCLHNAMAGVIGGIE